MTVSDDDDDEIKDFNIIERLKINKSTRVKKAKYDLLRQMTLMDAQIKKIKTYK